MRILIGIVLASLLAFAHSAASWAADPPSRAKNSNSNGPSDSKSDSEPRSEEWQRFAEYKKWKPIHPEPVAMLAQRNTLCRRMDSAPRNPHHGGFVSIYVNPTSREKYVAGTPGAFAEGTVIVKEKRPQKDSDEAHELGVMVKREKGYDAKSGDWQYLFVDEEQQLTSTRTKLINCISCHQGSKTIDHVFGQTKAEEDDESNSGRGNKSKGNSRGGNGRAK